VAVAAVAIAGKRLTTRKARPLRRAFFFCNL